MTASVVADRLGSHQFLRQSTLQTCIINIYSDKIFEGKHAKNIPSVRPVNTKVVIDPHTNTIPDRGKFPSRAAHLH